MVERLYRGKRIDNGEWVYGGYAHIYSNPNTDIIVTGRMCIYEDSDELTLEARNVDPTTVGQYTGLTDKNGKKIFEGDIVATPKYIGVVVYGTGCYCIKHGNNSPAIDIVMNDFDVYVIDNIHDNIQ